MSAEELVILVNEKDEELGVAEKMIAHQQGLLHRAFSVFVYRKVKGPVSHPLQSIEILLQLRHPDKYHCGGLWTNTCCSHPRQGESIIHAGVRRLKEELSIETTLKAIGSFQYLAEFENGLTEHEFDHVLVGEYDPRYPVIINTEEVENYRWITVLELKKDLELNATQYTPWFKPALTLVLEDLCFNF